MINAIRRFLIKHDPWLKAPKISENLFQPIDQPTIKEVKGDNTRQSEET